MTNTDDRRAKATQRVPMGTLVEICGNEPGIPAFEAESVDVSARGMQLRTAYLPELDAPLVCRFEDRGREIIVEGAVAWRREGARGGEFGIQFTALDSGSVEALRDLCGMTREASPETAPAEDGEAKNPPGSRVRLHIDGLGSPMKARVRGVNDRGVQVGSNLEFLKVGRRLEVEDLERGAKREAFIDAVSVAIDPKTQVPQLVVALRYEEAEESTPEPSVIDSEAGAAHADPSGGSSAAANTDGDELSGASAEEVDDDDLAGESREMRGRLAVAATQAGAVMQKGGAVLARVSASAAVGVGQLFKDASQRIIDYRQRRASQSEAPRRTAPAPSGVLSAEGRHLRRQGAQSATPEGGASSGSSRARAKRIAVAVGAAALLATVVVIATKSPAPPPGAEGQNGGPAVALASAENVTEVDEHGNPATRSGDKPADNAQKAVSESAQGGGISADVPLFGPTPMATMEPAPLGPAPAEGGEMAASAPLQDEEAAEKAAAAAVEDEAWQEPESKHTTAVRPEDVEPWGRGRMHTPTIHRLRLDGPGGAIQGAITATGFSVVIPGRKIMESGNGIEKRDKRIAKVRTKNAASGAHVSFQFRDGVPGYRVRLRRDYIEFLVSAPAQSAAEASKSANSSTGAKKSTPKKNATPQSNKNVAHKPKPRKG